MSGIELFFLLYVIVVSLLYVYGTKNEIPKLLPGDIYIHKEPRRIYIPLGSSLIITIILFIILNAFRKGFL